MHQSWLFNYQTQSITSKPYLTVCWKREFQFVQCSAYLASRKR